MFNHFDMLAAQKRKIFFILYMLLCLFRLEWTFCSCLKFHMFDIYVQNFDIFFIEQLTSQEYTRPWSWGMEDLIILARVFLRLVNQPIFSFQSEGIILALFAMHSHEP